MADLTRLSLSLCALGACTSVEPVHKADDSNDTDYLYCEVSSTYTPLEKSTQAVLTAEGEKLNRPLSALRLKEYTKNYELIAEPTSEDNCRFESEELGTIRIEPCYTGPLEKTAFFSGVRVDSDTGLFSLATTSHLNSLERIFIVFDDGQGKLDVLGFKPSLESISAQTTTSYLSDAPNIRVNQHRGMLRMEDGRLTSFLKVRNAKVKEDSECASDTEIKTTFHDPRHEGTFTMKLVKTFKTFRMGCEPPADTSQCVLRTQHDSLSKKVNRAKR